MIPALRGGVIGRKKGDCFGLLALVGLLLGGTGRAEPRHRVEAPAPEETHPWHRIRCRSPEGVLPAITSLNAFTSSPEEVKLPFTLPCPLPRVAVVAGTFTSERDVRRALSAIHDTLSFGYPVVANADDLWLEMPSDRIAVVVGLFDSQRDADRWRRTHRGFAAVRVRSAPGDNTASSSVQVVQVSGTSRVKAYDLNQALRLSRAERPLRDVASRCAVAQDALFVFDAETFGTAVYGKNNARADDPMFLVPVRCGGRLAYVDPVSTNYNAVYWIDRVGTRRVTQRSQWSCGYSRFVTSVIDVKGARVIEYDTALSYDGC